MLTGDLVMVSFRQQPAGESLGGLFGVLAASNRSVTKKELRHDPQKP
jgi:hypothetical protein